MLDKMDAHTDEEMREAYDELSADEFFDCNPDADQVKLVLGDGVYNEYMHWIYINIK